MPTLNKNDGRTRTCNLTPPDGDGPAPTLRPSIILGFANITKIFRH